MRSVHGYIILFLSFFGIIILQNYVDNKHGIVFQGGSILKSINQRIKLENKINKLEFTIDSLNAAMTIKPLTSIDKKNTFKIVSSNKQDKKGAKHFFGSLDEAVEIRNNKGTKSYIAQQYINIAYEMGGDDWYGAEEMWDTDQFRDRISTLELDK